MGPTERFMALSLTNITGNEINVTLSSHPQDEGLCHPSFTAVSLDVTSVNIFIRVTDVTVSCKNSPTETDTDNVIVRGTNWCLDRLNH